MGPTLSALVKRSFKNFNVDNRAQKLISPDVKPKMAPWHPSTEEILRNKPIDSKISSELLNKNEKLSSMLHNMIVETSKIPEIKTKEEKLRGKLPDNRSKVEDFEYGYPEPKIVKAGKCTLKQALEFLGYRQIDPEKFKVGFIAKEYNLDEADTQNVMDHFSVFRVVLPDRIKDVSIRDKIATGIPSLIKKALPQSTASSRDSKDGGTNNSTL